MTRWTRTTREEDLPKERRPRNDPEPPRREASVPNLPVPARPAKSAPEEFLRLPQLRGELVIDFVGCGVEIALVTHGGAVRRTIEVDAEDLQPVVKALARARDRVGGRT